MINHQNTPIIGISAHVSEENRKRYIRAGMDAVLNKPLTYAQCKDMIESFIPNLESKVPAYTMPLTFTADLPPNIDALFDLDSFSLLNINDALKSTGDETTLANVLSLMSHQSLPVDLQASIKAYQLKDWETIQALAHKIKGGAVYVGTHRLKMACQYLERYWKSGQRDKIEPLYQQMLEVIKETIQQIERWLASR